MSHSNGRAAAVACIRLIVPAVAGWPDRLTDGQAGNDGTADPAPETDHGIALGGIGSDLFPAAAPDEYWMVTDRGPNGQVEVDGKNRRTFPVPRFDPLLLRVRAQPDAPLTLLQVIPVTTTGPPPTLCVAGVPRSAIGMPRPSSPHTPRCVVGTGPPPARPGHHTSPSATPSSFAVAGVILRVASIDDTHGRVRDHDLT